MFYGAFFLSKFNLSFVFITDIRFSSSTFVLFKSEICFSSSTFVLFMLDVRSFRSKFVSSLTFVFQVQHLFFEDRIRFSSLTLILFMFDVHSLRLTFVSLKSDIRFIEVQVQRSFYSSVRLTEKEREL